MGRALVIIQPEFFLKDRLAFHRAKKDYNLSKEEILKRAHVSSHPRTIYEIEGMNITTRGIYPGLRIVNGEYFTEEEQFAKKSIEASMARLEELDKELMKRQRFEYLDRYEPPLPDYEYDSSSESSNQAHQ